MLKEAFANQVYNKLINKYFHLKSSFCDREISDLYLSLDSFGYKACKEKVELLGGSFIEVRQPEVINNIYKITNTTNNTSTSSRIDISVSTVSTTPLIVGQFTYQNDKLIGQNPPVIFVNNVPEFEISGQFTIDPITGILTRSQSWSSLDTLVII